MSIFIRALAVVAAITIFLLPQGCSKKPTTQKNLSEAVLFARGQQMEKQGKHENAAESFRQIVERFPNSPLAPESQFSLASNLMKLKGAREAEAAFDDFLRLYPAHPKVPDALFLKSELLRRQILLPGRAQEKTRESITTYKRFLEKEQDTPRAETAVSRIKELNNHLLLHEEAIISHLISTRKYDSAMLRAKRVLEEFPEAAQSDKFQSMLALAVKKQTKKDEAVDGAEQTPTIIDEQTPKNLDEQTPKNLDEKTPKNPDN